ncbi:hypothetical protein E2562_033119 [Oryza meyeriana var. granulata]|uniref:Uncharacterized protein n=1 Tax=Oryza meyeriana var. granulata TaxID=110450 RepID=A0A6G1CKM7_9ORYZ|nr:hypothetical protein E2562_033119 [Oryza meyeriana var. granulata]
MTTAFQQLPVTFDVEEVVARDLLSTAVLMVMAVQPCDGGNNDKQRLKGGGIDGEKSRHDCEARA